MKWNSKSEAIIQFFAVIIQLILITSGDFRVKNFENPIAEDTILCRSCGTDLTTTQKLINTRVSKDSEYAKNETLFDKPEVLVQELKNPHGLRFRVVLVQVAECKATASDNWTSTSSWFKGFAWKSCHCPRCGTHLGWMFEPVQSSSTTDIPTKEGFYALIVTSVVDEHFVDSLLMREKVFRD